MNSKRTLPRSGRRAFLTAVAAGAGLALAGCAPESPEQYGLGAGEPKGFFTEFSTLLAAAVERSNAGFRLDPKPSSGTIQNLDMLQEGTASLALALADAARAEPAGLHSIGRVYQNYFQFAVPAGSEARSLADFKGQRISLGPDNSGTQFTGRRILSAAGLGTDDVELHPLALTQITDALADGTVRGALFAGGLPAGVIEASTNSRGRAIRLLGLGDELKELQRRHGAVYKAARIPAGVYGADAEVGTIGVASLLLARLGLPNDVAGGLVRILVSRAADLVPADALGAQYLDARSLIYTSGIPLHPGAAAAYRQIHG